MRSLATTPDLQADATIDPQELRELGERAALKFMNDHAPLVEAVARTLEASGRTFNKHHVQRVVEYANLRAFRALRQPGPGEIGKVVEFPEGPATAVAVIARLRHTTPTEEKMGSLAHLVSPPTGMAKLAEAERCGSMYGFMLNMRDAADACRSEAVVLQHKMAAVQSDICRHAEYVLRNGAELGDVHAALAAGCPNKPVMLKIAMDLVLAKAAPRAGLYGEEGAASMEKRASGTPNPNHPLVTKMAEMVSLYDQLSVKSRAAEILDEQRRNLYRSAVGG
jgi:hypothetical protein